MASIDEAESIANKMGLSSVNDAQSVISFGQDTEAESDSEPEAKRFKEETDLEYNYPEEQSIKQILFNINKAICLRLDGIENKLSNLSSKFHTLENKLENLCNQLKSPIKTGLPIARRGAVIVGLPQERSAYDLSPENGISGLGPNVQLITLNTEEDFPNGTWLGDENNPEMRVRVPITASDILHVHSNCRTPEKMALALLDYLFDRDTQACSNISGLGKHGKQQLDPLMIYGIRCHLFQRFGISEQDWHRIKQNIDSKCRTAFRRKVKGLPLTVKAFKGKMPPNYIDSGMSQGLSSDEESMSSEQMQMQTQNGVNLQHNILTEATAAEIIQSASGGEIQVLHATPEQVAQLQKSHQIQIFQGDSAQLMTTGVMLQGEDGTREYQVSVAIPTSALAAQVKDSTDAGLLQSNSSMLNVSDGNISIKSDISD